MIRNAGIKMRFFICESDDFCMGGLPEYRWLKKDLFVTSDVKVIYDDCVAYLIRKDDDMKIIVLKDLNIARDSRRIFNYIWDQSEGPGKSTAKQSYGDTPKKEEVRHAG